MLYNTPKSVLDDVAKIMRESAEKAAKEKIEEEQRLKALREKVVHPNQQKIDVHEPEKDEITAKDFEMLRARKKAKEMKKEEVEQVNEISKKTVGSYINKASVDMANRTAEGERKRTLAGADYAVNIRRGMSPKNAEADMKKDYAAAKLDVKKSVQRMRGIEKATSRLTKEEIDELDELSKSTLASYAKKAAGSAETAGLIASRSASLSGQESKPMLDIVGKRTLGIKKAVNRLAKEELEIEEAKDTPGQSHQCALHVKSEQFGEGKTLFSQHAEPDENGNIAWYDVMFEHGIEKQVPTSELDILVSEAHMNHSKKKMKEEVDLEEGRGRPRKHPPKPMKKGEDDEDDDYGPDSGPEPEQNIVMHLKKSVDTAGGHDVKFADGSSHKVPAHVAHRVLGAMGKLKPSDRLEVQKHIHASHKNLMDVHRMIK